MNPDSPLVASELGRAYLTSGEPGRALSEFGRALAMAPDNPQALSNRGVALLILKQTAAAKSDFERALQIDPCAFEARLNALRMGLHRLLRRNADIRRRSKGAVRSMNLRCRPNRDASPSSIEHAACAAHDDGVCTGRRVFYGHGSAGTEVR